MADPVVIECTSACTITVVHDLALPPLQLTPEEGGQVAASILFLWAAAWAFRMAIRALNVDRKEESSSSD
ncbi:MAG: hypothetical protein O9318_07240 [Hylemonella sp.]|uniref:hypothetical protein n=1 Tax=Hylemonella sp. TaxID=2066020 RepID=UPI0022C10F48|nr:hypothetical protein [Hylemonella sp.]MCZ8252247.1 hypothetical protein [Hylemonella sp.]